MVKHHPPAGTPPAFVSSISGDSGGGASTTVQTAASTLSAGNASVVTCMIQAPCGSLTVSVTDLSSGSNSYTQIGTSITDGAGALCGALFYAKNATPVTNNKYTCTWSGSAQSAVSATQISGASASAPYVTGSFADGTTSGSFGNTATTSAFSPPSASLTMCGISVYEQFKTITATSPYTMPSASIPTQAQAAMMYNAYPSGGSGVTATSNISTPAGIMNLLCATFH